MASGCTNKGKFNILGQKYRGVTIPTNYYVILFTSASTPDADTNIVSDHTEIAAGNGYATGGYQLTPNATDYDVLTEDDTNDWALIQIKDIVWTASGGPIPASGNGARWAGHTDDNVTIANREIEQWWDLVSDRQVSVGQSLTLQDCEIRGT
jgi:hypothetical protein